MSFPLWVLGFYLLCMDYDGKLTIDGCIKYIVLGRKFFLDDNKIKQLIDLIVNPDSICYKKFVPHSFATTCYDSHGYSTFEIAFKIHGVIKKYSSINILYNSNEYSCPKSHSIYSVLNELNSLFSFSYLQGGIKLSLIKS